MDLDHFFSTEARFDGGVLELAKGAPNFNATPFPDNTTTFDLGNYIVDGQYNSKLDGDLAGTGVPGTVLARPARVFRNQRTSSRARRAR